MDKSNHKGLSIKVVTAVYSAVVIIVLTIIVVVAGYSLYQKHVFDNYKKYVTTVLEYAYSVTNEYSFGDMISQRLMSEKYEVMKTHTTYGKEIIEKAIDTVEGGSYLKEACNMAAYHHERWDGKGYPEGLKGEEIPLSARVMAVADVFDALSSNRVYKPAFPLEEAIRIIEEGKGTQFDPKCVEVFLDALPDVKATLKRYSRK